MEGAFRGYRLDGGDHRSQTWSMMAWQKEALSAEVRLWLHIALSTTNLRVPNQTIQKVCQNEDQHQQGIDDYFCGGEAVSAFHRVYPRALTLSTDSCPLL